LNYKYDGFYLKVIKQNADKNYVRNFPLISDELIKLNIGNSRFLKNDYNEYISEISYQNERYYIYIQKYIEGSFYTGTKEEFIASLEMIKKLRCFEFRSEENKTKSPFLSFKPIEVVSKVKEKLEDSDFDSLVKGNLSFLIEVLKKNQKQLDYLSKPAKSLYHYDLHPHNLICKGGRIVSLVDLESFVCIQQELSEAFGIYKLGRKAISKNYFNVEEFKKLVSQDFGLSLLYPFVELELLRRLILIIDLHYLRNNNEWDCDFEKHLQGLKEAQVMFK